MKRKVLCLFVSLFLMTGTMWAQYVTPSEGVFRIINVEYNSALTENILSSTLMCSVTGGEDAYEQMWILKSSGTNYTIQNVYTGKYIQTGNNGTEVPYWTDATPKPFHIVANSSKGADAYNIFDPALGTAGLHSKGESAPVVRWWSEGHKAASEWKFVSVEISDEDLERVQGSLSTLLANEKVYEETLAMYFEDEACTRLRTNYQVMSDDALRSAMGGNALPDALIDMAVKVKNDSWAEANENPDKPSWDSDYAKKFRVQLIEPHSIAGEITEWLGHQAHSNMDNPTGIYANSRDVTFIMVEGEIKEGAELWLNYLTGHNKMPNYNNGYSNGVRLHRGLNVVPGVADGSAYFINYLVHTYDKSTKTFPHKLSDYPDLKVHISGGYINGYYNAAGDALYEADTDRDWEYYEDRANLRNITILGRHEVFQFELNDVTVIDGSNTRTERGLAKLFPDELPASLPEGQRINAIIEVWDRIVLSEKMTLGEVSKEVVDSMNQLFPRWDSQWKTKAAIYDYDGYQEFCGGRDYSEYYNHRALAFGTTTGYMYGSWDHTGYHINTTPSILTQIATEAGPAWGPAHEVGHQHQTLFTVNGLTEVTNNLFSNIAVWYMGMGTSRVNETEGNLAHVYESYRNGGDFFSNNIWALTQMYYRLWLYYHRVGHNPQFYPRLFELLRNHPMDKSGTWSSEERDGENVSFQYTQGKSTILHFYQLCCDAAQEDLTEFFRAHGFFRVMDNRFVGDYSNSKFNQTQDDIDQAIAAVKAKGYPLNTKVLFINDCTPDATYGHDGKTLRSYWDGNATQNGTNAELGGYVDFLANDSVTGKYQYTLRNCQVKVSGDGEGALGFAVYTDDNEIVAFSNHRAFMLSEEVALRLLNGTARVVAVAAVGDTELECANATVVSATLPLEFTPGENGFIEGATINSNGLVEYSSPLYKFGGKVKTLRITVKKNYKNVKYFCLSELAFYDANGIKINLTEQDVTSNADHNALNPNDTDGGGILALFDDNQSTYFHSAWKNMPDEDHYLEITFPNAGYDMLSFSMLARGSNQNHTFPAEMVISSPDDLSGITEAIGIFNAAYAEFVSLADSCSHMEMLPVVVGQFETVLAKVDGMRDHLSDMPLDTLTAYTLIMQETAAYTKAMDAKYIEWQNVFFTCDACQDSITATPEATTAFTAVLVRHRAYLSSMPAVTADDIDALIAELETARKAFEDAVVPDTPEVPLQGDVNGDGKYTMMDVVMLVNAVLNRPQGGYDATVADMNGDGQVTIIDVVSVLRLVLGNEPVAAARGMYREASAISLEAGDVSLAANGEFVLPIYMNNTAAYTAFQVDVVLPEGMILSNATLGERAKSSHSMAWSTLDNGVTRIVAYAMDNATFKDNEGALMQLTLAANEAVTDDAVLTLADGLFATANGREDSIADVSVMMRAETTGVDVLRGGLRISGAEGAVVVEAAAAGEVSIYSLTGQLVQTVAVEVGTSEIALPAGLYIVNDYRIIVK